MADKVFGSGNFGEWVEDEWGLPAYHYTCDQTKEPRAVTPVNPIWRSPTDHSHQVGNQRLVAVASNYGYVQVRQDEGGPKFLNDYAPALGRFAGGFGYLTDGKEALSTYYPGNAESFERYFGIGYVRKIASRGGYAADQVIFAPYGDDPIIISQVTLTNQTNHAAVLRWIEYWGCQMIQFSHRSQVVSIISRGKRRVPDLRREFASRFTHAFSVIGERLGLLNEKKFAGYPLKDRITWGIDQLLLSTIARKSTGGALKAPVKQAWLEDLAPPPTFLVSLNGPADGLATGEADFFGKGGVEHPDGLLTPLPKKLMPSNKGTCLLLEREVSLASGESRTLFFAYGYLPSGFNLETLLSKYREDLPHLWARSSESWKEGGMRFQVPNEDWVRRELTWHDYYLRSDLTYDTFFQEHILSQGHVYQYVIGFQGAARDPLQHALPLVFSHPETVREVLRYTLKEVLPDGEIPYGVTGHGMRMAVSFRPSDQEMWLLWLCSEYVLATRDTDFLDEEIPTFPLYGPKAGKESVRNMLRRCFLHLTQVTGTGKHGLMRLSNGDWNDGAVIGFVPADQHERVRQQGESVLNAAFASYVLDQYAQMLSFIEAQQQASEAHNLAEEQRKNTRMQWADRWFRRSWLNESLGWIGEDVLWLEPQPWAIIAGAATPEQKKTLVEAIHEMLREPSPIGAMLLSRSIPQIATAAGDLTNGAVWPSINGTLIWALALVNGEMAWDEWKKNTLAYHAQAYPDIWYGIWSGPDTYNSVLSKHPGHTFFDEKVLQGEQPDSPLGSGTNWTDFPVMNMHPHAWSLYTITKLLGVEFTPQGVLLSPKIPKDSYNFETPLLGLKKSPEGYSGWYAPIKAGRWQIALRLPEQERKRLTRLEINGSQHPIQLDEGQGFHWIGESVPGKPLQWNLR